MKNTQERVAIIGMAIRCPGAQNVVEFWSNLKNGVESISFATDEDLRAIGTPESLLRSPNFVRASAPLEGLDLFDAGFFNYSATEAEYIDPQQRVFLECSVEALESAGIDPARYPGSIGIFAGEGQLLYGYQILSDRSLIGVERHMAIIGNDKDYLATRASFKLGLRGPSFTLQCACSTSTVAMHLAAQSLSSHECDVALAGGVSVSWLRGKSGYHFVEGGILSRDGHTRAFDADASGTVFADGTALVVMKRLGEAIADGDDIQAVIIGSAVNNDGATKDSYTAPSIEGQYAVLSKALDVAGVSPETIGYVEAHGTGTALGDPIEIEALTRVFRTATDRKQFCGVGSLKTNIGHLNTISGLASTIKAALCVKTGEIPASLHFDTPNPKIDFASSPFYVPTRLTEWTSDRPRRACISAFGIGGTNTVVIVEEPPRVDGSPSGKSMHVATVTAKSEAALDAACARLADHLREHPEESIADVCHTLAEGRSQYPHARAVVCDSTQDAVNALESGPPISGVRSIPGKPVTFLFPGQGSQHICMGRELYREEPVFRRELDRCAEGFRDHIGIDLRTLLHPEKEEQVNEAEKLLRETRYTQPAIFAVSYALAQTWIRLGVRPTMALGHSIGEFVAACIADVFSLEDALRAVAERGRLIQSMPGGKMLAIMSPVEQVEPLFPPSISLAVVNAASACVASGPHDDVAGLASALEEQGISSTVLHTSHAFHSHMMEPAVCPFIETMRGIKLKPPMVPYVSNVTGDWITDEQATDPSYWGSHIRQAVLFHKGLCCIQERGPSIFLEVGPGRSLGTLARSLGAEARAISSLPHAAARGVGEVKAFLQAAAELWTLGVPIVWSRRYEGERRLKRPLPTYPFERERYWVLPDIKPTPAPAEETDQDAGQAAALAGAQASAQGTAQKTAGAQGASAKQAKRDASRYLVETATWKRLQYAARSEKQANLAWLVFLADEAVDEHFAKILRSAYGNVTLVKKGRVYSNLGDSSFSCNLNREDDLGELCTLVVKLLDEGQRLQVVYFCNRSRQRPADKLASRYRREVNDKINAPINLIRSITRDAKAENIGLTIITREGQEISGAETVEPMMALAIGPCLASMHEYPGLHCRVVDVPVKASSVDDLARSLAADLAEPRQSIVTAYRGNARWVRTIDRIPSFLRKGPQAAFREGGVYLITGGLGALGLALSLDLAKNYCARLILTGRTQMPPGEIWPDILEDEEEGREDRLVRAIRGIQEVEAAGGEVMTGAADVCDLAQMQKVVEAATERFGEIHGVIHAAGVPGTTPIGLKTPDEVDAVLRPKILGLAVLEQIFAKANLDFLALFSSTSAIWGRVGQVDYIAANAYLDAYAIRSWGKATWPMVSINWDNWREVGMAVDTQQSGPGRAAQVKGLETVDAVYAFGEALMARQPQVIVRGRARAAAPARARGGEAKAPESKPKKQEPRAYPRPALAEPYQEPNSELETDLAIVWTKLLRIAPIGRNDNFFELGGHSLLGLQFLPSVRDKYQVTLDPRELFENPTIAKLAAAIQAKSVQRT